MDITKVVKKIRKYIGDFQPEIALMLGSGFADTELVKDIISVDYKTLKMPVSKVSGHSGKFIFGVIGEKKVVMCSRYHYYESKNMDFVRLPFLIAKELGAKSMIMQTSAGAVNKKLTCGQIVLIEDHINLTGDNPLLALSTIDFINMTDCYDTTLRKITSDCAKANNIKLEKGIHIQLTGPTYETPAEINMIRQLGADTVSMSMCYDTIIARSLDLKVLGFAVITNETGGANAKSLNHEEVKRNSKLALNDLIILIKSIIAKM